MNWGFLNQSSTPTYFLNGENMGAAHKYYCGHCKAYVFGDDLKALCFAVNHHNTQLHPIDYASWTENEMVASTMYALATEMPAYLAIYKAASEPDKDWGDAKYAPKITEDDKIMLLRGGVKW